MSWIDTEGKEQVGDNTAGGRPVYVPECQVWCVSPRQPLDDDQWSDLLNQMRDRQIPGLKCGDQITNDRLAQVSELDHLNYLDLSGMNRGITDDGLWHLRTLKRLHHLNLNLNSGMNNPRLAPARVALAAEVSNLRQLFMSHSVAGDDGFTALSRHPRLEGLGAQHCQNLRDRGFAALSRLPKLRNLFISSRFMHDQMIAPMAEFQALEEFCPAGDNNLTDEVFADIIRAPKLRRLINMYVANAGDRATEHVVKSDIVTCYMV